MARPKPPPDPSRHSPCSRCGLAYERVANWPDGPACGYCYRAAHRTRGKCSQCSHEGVLPGRDDDGKPTCRDCSGIKLNIDCRRCGAEDELYHIDDYADWLTRKLSSIEDAEDRRIIERFGRWHNLRRLRRHARRDNPTHGAFLRAKQSTTVAINFVEYLRGRGLVLEDLGQADIDAWYAG